MTDEQWNAGMELKLHGARRLTIRAWDALKQAGGSVVFMSGSASLDPKPAFAAVAATNAAITALAKAFLRNRGSSDGVQVNSIVPGPVMTGRRQCVFLRSGRPAHSMSVEDAMKKFPEEAGISRFMKGAGRDCGSCAGLHGFSGREVDDGRKVSAHGWGRD